MFRVVRSVHRGFPPHLLSASTRRHLSSLGKGQDRGGFASKYGIHIAFGATMVRICLGNPGLSPAL
jgi:hypothetical protein